MNICLIDYGAGNLASVIKAFRVVGGEPIVTASPVVVARARAIVVPGVGHFERTAAIDPDLRAAIGEAIDAGASLFGICLGMQFLFEGSREAPGVPGLGKLGGCCAAIPAKPGLKIPHVGWNVLVRTGQSSRLLEKVAPNATFSTSAPSMVTVRAFGVGSAVVSA